MKIFTFILFYLCSLNLNALGCLSATFYHTEVKVFDLRCQYKQSPVGIEEKSPSLSWKINTLERNGKQAAYQIVVATSMDKLDHDPDLWNSGKIISSQNAFVSYKGLPLQSAQQYFWKVRVWSDGNTESGWSSPTSFTTGILNQDEWSNANWIAYEKLPDNLRLFPGIHGNGDDLGNKALKRAVVPCFRKDLNLTRPIKQALIFACGLGQYVLSVNGKRASNDFLNPAWSDYTKRCYYNAYDVTSLLRNGENTIGAIVGTGFLYINRERYRKLVIAGGYPMLRLKVYIRYEDGSTAEMGTDGSWKTAPSAITYSSIYGGEDFDANKINAGWDKPGFDDKKWRRPVIVSGPGGIMEAQESYPLETEEKFTPVKIDSSKKNYRLFDFGQNISGIIRFQGTAPKGYKIRMIPSELINEDNSPDQSASGQPYYWDYIFSGKGLESWQPMFSYYGFRYVGVEVFDRKGKQVDINNVKISSLISLHTQNASPVAGSFRCSDTLFNKIFNLIRWGIRNNMASVATDCPHREKLGWLEETHLLGNSIRYNYDILRFYHKISEDMRDAQLDNGLVPDIAPEYVEFTDGFRDSPEWGSASVLVPWYTFQWYGDTSVLRENYAMMKKYVDYLKSKSNQYLLAYGLGDWFDLGPKQPGVSQLTPLGLTATAFYFYDAKIVAKIATMLGHQEEAKIFSVLADSVRMAFNKKYFNERTHVYATGSQTSYAIPLYFGLAPENDRQAILSNLVDSVEANNYALTAGDIGFRYLIQVLEEGGYNDLIYKMNNRIDIPGYGYQISKGATALTESWQALRNVSNDHMMLGHLMEWFYSGLGGIRQEEGTVGYQHVVISPQFVSGINWVDCDYDAINGKITVHWERKDNGRIRLQVHIPANSDAKIILPVVHPDAVKESGKSINDPKSGLKYITEKKGITLMTGSGDYDFVLTL